jgi:hypothetical protein
MKSDKKTIAIMQPYFLPYIGYFQLIDAVDIFVIYDDVNYINRGWINRNRILLNNADRFITIPLSKASQNKLINEIKITDDAALQQKNILEQIKQSYKKAVSFEEFYPIVEKIILNPEQDLVGYLTNSLKEICNYLGIVFKPLLSSSIEKDNSKKGQSKIIEICKKLEAGRYINPAGGVDLYDKNSFESEAIDLKFISTKPIIYQQFKEDFIPYLSVVDLLMMSSKAQAKIFIKNYDLV